jgi:murein DD-endopeptidase MepM/ murein hydrolase activator NlpD
MARRMPPRSIDRQMARPLVPGQQKQAAGPNFRRWVGPALLVTVSFLGLVPLAGLGGGTPVGPSKATPSVEAPITTITTAESAALAPVAGRSSLPSRPWSSLPGEQLAVKSPRPSAPLGGQRQVIEIGFPLAAGVNYRYRDNYGDLRPGPVEWYNHVFDERDGKLRRAHDGVDIYAPRDTAVLAPFAGVVIDPRTRWQPWQRDRYGLTVAIVSTEPATRGYVVLLCHLDVRTVQIGAHVKRGREVGTLGITGNAEESPAQLHFELRAPSLMPWHEAGGDRLLDAFNPYPSLRAAERRRTN